MKLHLETLPAAQLEALRTVGPALERRGFYLAGGTALALRLGHRISVDLDWFREADFDPLALAGDLRREGLPIAVADTAPGTLHASLGPLRLSLFRYAYPNLAAPETAPEVGCRLAALEDLVAMKLAAVAQRGARKDFHDIAAILTTGLGLSDQVELYRRKFDVSDVGHLLSALCYFDDAEGEPEPTLLAGPNWQALKADLRSRVRSLAT